MKVRRFLIGIIIAFVFVIGSSFQISANTDKVSTSKAEVCKAVKAKQKKKVKVKNKDKPAKQKVKNKPPKQKVKNKPPKQKVKNKRKAKQKQAKAKPAEETHEQQAETLALPAVKDPVFYRTFGPHGYTYFFSTTPDADTSARGGMTITPYGAGDTNPLEYYVEYKTELSTREVKGFFGKTRDVLLYVPKKIGQGVLYIGKGAKRLFWR